MAGAGGGVLGGCSEAEPRQGDLRWRQEQQLQGAGGGGGLTPWCAAWRRDRSSRLGGRAEPSAASAEQCVCASREHRPTPGWDCCTLSPGHPGSRSPCRQHRSPGYTARVAAHTRSRTQLEGGVRSRVTSLLGTRIRPEQGK